MRLVLFTKRHREETAGVISCYGPDADPRHVAGLRCAQGMTNYLYARQIRIFKYPPWAQPLHETLRQSAERRGGTGWRPASAVMKNETRKHKVLRIRFSRWQVILSEVPNNRANQSRKDLPAGNRRTASGPVTAIQRPRHHGCG
jgi:hypothetical protein